MDRFKTLTTALPAESGKPSSAAGGNATRTVEEMNRAALSAGELDLLAKLEERNAVLLGCGLTYPERKQALSRFAADWRTPRLAAA